MAAISVKYHLHSTHILPQPITSAYSLHYQIWTNVWHLHSNSSHLSMSQPATPIHQPITATLHLNSHIWSLMSSCRAYTPTNHRPISIYGHTPKNSSSSHIAMPLLTTRQFSRHIQTILINAAPASSYQTTRRYYLIYLGDQPIPNLG